MRRAGLRQQSSKEHPASKLSKKGNQMQSDTETLRVLRFSANNILRLSVVDITPDKDVMVIGGRNAQGKSSILNSIMAAVGGAKNRPKELLKKGQKKGTVTLEIGDTEPKYILTLTVTPEGERITLTTKEGAKFNGCQIWLEVVGNRADASVIIEDGAVKEAR